MKRRDFLAAGGAALLVDRLGAQTPLPGLGGAVRRGRVKVDIPPLVDNGNAVPLTVTVDSPMTVTDRVLAIHIRAEKNPEPHVATFHFGPRAGRAVVSTRIRLADTQTVTAYATMADGTVWAGSADAIVTMAACLETDDG